MCLFTIYVNATCIQVLLDRRVVTSVCLSLQTLRYKARDVDRSSWHWHSGWRFINLRQPLCKCREFLVRFHFNMATGAVTGTAVVLINILTPYYGRKCEISSMYSMGKLYLVVIYYNHWMRNEELDAQFRINNVIYIRVIVNTWCSPCCKSWLVAVVACDWLVWAGQWQAVREVNKATPLLFGKHAPSQLWRAATEGTRLRCLHDKATGTAVPYVTTSPDNTDSLPLATSSFISSG